MLCRDYLYTMLMIRFIHEELRDPTMVVLETPLVQALFMGKSTAYHHHHFDDGVIQRHSLHEH